MTCVDTKELLKELKASKSIFKPLFGDIWLQMPGKKKVATKEMEQHAVLEEIKTQKTPTSLLIANALNLNRETVGTIIKRLAAQGLIVRVSKNKDNSSVYGVTVKGISKLRSNKN